MSTWQNGVLTGNGSVVRWFDDDGNEMGPYAVFTLDDEREAALLWWALYVAYGNEYRAAGLGAKLRAAVGEDRYGHIAEAGSEVGREHPAHPADELEGE